jgi:hypothetical protein
MADTGTKSRSLLAPLIGGVVLVALLFLTIAFRDQLRDAIASSSSRGGGAVLAWIPDHVDETLAIVVAFLVAIGINWIAHVIGRLSAWIFVVVVEIGLLIVLILSGIVFWILEAKEKWAERRHRLDTD